jgi:hypothetical protein
MPDADAATNDLEASIDELFGLPLQDFTGARNALAKRLTAGGDKAAAVSVKALRKPAITAWALNQVARRHPDGVTALLQSGEELRQAHRLALEGDASALRAATRAQQQRVSDLAREAAAILEEAGSSSGSHAERLAESLRAAATDDAAGAQLRQGRLTNDLETAGFGFAGDLDVAPAAPRRPTKTVTEAAGDGTADDDAAADTTDEAAQAERREQERAVAKQRLATARRSAERRRAKATEAAEKAARLAEEADRAEDVAAEARRRADAAAGDAGEASDHAAAADAALDEAQRAVDALG